MNILLLVGELLLILLRASGLTDRVAFIAKRLYTSNIAIGLTVAAFGTPAPEPTVSVSPVLKGSADITIGNVVGSSILNILMIVGCTALFVPVAVARNILQKEVPLCILSSIALLIRANDIFPNGDEANILSITDGPSLFCFFAIFMSCTFAIASCTPGEAVDDEENIEQPSLWKSTFYILEGLGVPIVDGSFSVDGASGITHNLEVGESAIGLILVTGGTSFPELTAPIVATLKKNPEIAIGNVAGSNLFDIFFVLGCSASIALLHLTGITSLGLWVLTGSGILLWLFGLFFVRHTIIRVEGGIVALCYTAYTVFFIYSL